MVLVTLVFWVEKQQLKDSLNFNHKVFVTIWGLNAGCPIYWQSKLQTEIALSTAEAEYIVLSQALREALPMTSLMKEINVIFPLYLTSPRFDIKVREDNQSCIMMAQNPRFSPRTKHIAIKYHHFCKHVITQSHPNGFLDIDYCSTDDQIADIFTKPVCDDIFTCGYSRCY